MKRNKDFERWLFNEAMIEVKQEVKLNEMVEDILIKDFPLSQDLIDYGTKTIDGEYYPLPKQRYLQLIFVGNKKIPFCTIRRFTYQKWGYYSLQVGKEFEIVMVVE